VVLQFGALAGATTACGRKTEGCAAGETGARCFAELDKLIPGWCARPRAARPAAPAAPCSQLSLHLTPPDQGDAPSLRMRVRQLTQALAVATRAGGA
jgi:hypothetical protein